MTTSPRALQKGCRTSAYDNSRAREAALEEIELRALIAPLLKRRQREIVLYIAAKELEGDRVLLLGRHSSEHLVVAHSVSDDLFDGLLQRRPTVSIADLCVDLLASPVFVSNP